MKKIFSAILMIIVFCFLFFLIRTYFDWYVDPLEENNNSNILFVLHRLGNLLLSLVYISFIGAFGFLGILLIYFSYCLVKLDFDAIKELKDLGLPTIIILGSITLLSIAGVQLRSLRNDNREDFKKNEETNYQYHGKPQYPDYFYFNDSIKDWVKVNKMGYYGNANQKHLVLERKSQTQYFFKSDNGSWFKCGEGLYHRWLKSKVHEVRELTPKPIVKYYIWESNEWHKITLDEFLKYRQLDSLVRYE